MPPQGQGRARRVCPRPRDGGPPSSRNAADCRVYDARWMSHLCAGRRVTPERRVHWSRENEAPRVASQWVPEAVRPGFLVRAEDRVTGRGSEGRGVGEARRWLRRGRRVPRGAPAADVSRPGPGFFFSSRGGDSPLQRHQPQRTLSRRLTGPLIVCTRRSRHGRAAAS